MMILGLFLVVFICFQHKKGKFVMLWNLSFLLKQDLKKEKINILSLLLKAFNGKNKMYNKVHGEANNNICLFS
jgi:hypothetical protein